jgi:hypothetical protein
VQLSFFLKTGTYAETTPQGGSGGSGSTGFATLTQSRRCGSAEERQDRRRLRRDGTIGLAGLLAPGERPRQDRHADLGVAVERDAAALAEALVAGDAPLIEARWCVLPRAFRLMGALGCGLRCVLVDPRPAALDPRAVARGDRAVGAGCGAIDAGSPRRLIPEWAVFIPNKDGGMLAPSSASVRARGLSRPIALPPVHGKTG